MPYWIVDSRFKPFNDDPFYYGKTNRNLSVSAGINTTAIDNFREGVNVRNTNDIYKSNQVKISFVDGSGDLEILPNGDLTNQSQFITFGQAVDFIQYTGQAAFMDSHVGVEGTSIKSNGLRLPRTVDYLIDNAAIVEGFVQPDVLYPVYMNGGPQFFEECIIEPFPIPNRLATNESPQEISKGIFAFLEGGNVGDERRFGSSNNEQMIYRDQPLVVRPYLEYGANYLLVTNSIGNVIKFIESKPSAIPDQSTVAKIKPWIDEPKNIYFPRFTDTLDLLSASVKNNNTTIPFYSLNYGTNDTEIQSRDQKSAPAGYSYYGGNTGLYGTDSIAFGGLYRGS